jgi:hypothetical protein
MGLLLTTSFLGVRRYLRQKNLRMPVAMTGLWMTIGGLLIAAFLVVGAILPRPYSETPIIDLNSNNSGDREASKNAVVKDSSTGKGEGTPGDKTTKGDGNKTAKDGGSPTAKGNDGKKGGGNDQGKNGNQSKEGKNGNDSKKGNSDDRKDPNKSDSSGSSRDKDQQEQQKGDKTENEQDSSNDSRQTSSKIGAALEKFASFLKWVIFGVLALVLVFFLFRGVLRHFANFMPWAKNLLDALQRFWEMLFGGRKPKPTKQLETRQTLEAIAAPVPFSAFSNPFQDGTAEGRSNEDLIRYTFLALEAWANDRQESRQPNETPTEFARRISESHPELATSLQRLVILYSRLAYSIGSLPNNTKAMLAECWEQLG